VFGPAAGRAATDRPAVERSPENLVHHDQAILDAAARLVASRSAQGLHAKVEDPVALAIVAGVLASARRRDTRPPLTLRSPSVVVSPMAGASAEISQRSSHNPAVTPSDTAGPPVKPRLGGRRAANSAGEAVSAPAIRVLEQVRGLTWPLSASGDLGRARQVAWWATSLSDAISETRDVGGQCRAA
jgi:hypothetical protein